MFKMSYTATEDEILAELGIFRRQTAEEEMSGDSDEEEEEDFTETAPTGTAVREYIATIARKSVKRKFRQFLRTYHIESKDNSTPVPIYKERIANMCRSNKCSLEVSFDHISDQPVLATWLADAPAQMIPILDEVAMEETLAMFPNFDRIHDEIHVRVTDLPVLDSLRNIRCVTLASCITMTNSR
jgi:DNA replication licensing factor MCM2